MPHAIGHHSRTARAAENGLAKPNLGLHDTPRHHGSRLVTRGSRVRVPSPACAPMALQSRSAEPEAPFEIRNAEPTQAVRRNHMDASAMPYAACACAVEKSASKRLSTASAVVGSPMKDP